MKPTPTLVREVQDFLDRFTRAITAGDGAGAATLWETPALVLGDDMAKCVTSAEDVARFYGGAQSQYHARGIVDTRAEIRALEALTDRIVLVTVWFPWLDEGGKLRGGETSTYTLRREEGGGLKLRSALMHGAE